MRKRTIAVLLALAIGAIAALPVLAATLAYVAGFEAIGAVLGGLVAVLALLAAATGFCAGCEAYKLGYVVTGRRFIACPLPPRPSPVAQRP